MAFFLTTVSTNPSLIMEFELCFVFIVTRWCGVAKVLPRRRKQPPVTRPFQMKLSTETRPSTPSICYFEPVSKSSDTLSVFRTWLFWRRSNLITQSSSGSQLNHTRRSHR
ncbi:Uncharacterized protein HZ326_11233 [Fusarium oxysporum f. sp. albedinis]|nr:Uncharacterized protein HZ326_11233 [Fusarium oxysporum f. sp. albedinis]